MLRYHHCRDLKSVVYGEVTHSVEYADEFFRSAYKWLEEETGLYPIFLAVGETEEHMRMTGYQDNWRIVTGSKIIGRRKNGAYIHRNILRKAGEFPNHVLFSFEEVEGVFLDDCYWHSVLNYDEKSGITDYLRRLVFKPSLNKAGWLRKSRKQPCSVELITGKLDLTKAGRIWVRNNETRTKLENMGFENIIVKRIAVEEI